ncbi:hypothetical protein CGI32_24800 [Vibrio parahaemolyticus]|nr:hypothetical protein CGI32_24800 [Vibrio parahaemolyticus]
MPMPQIQNGVIMEDSIFKCYQTDFFCGFGQATVIVTADQIAKDKVYSEFFVFIRGDKKEFFGCVFELDTAGAPDYVIQADIDSSIEEALLQASSRISQCQLKVAEHNKNDFWMRFNTDLKEAGTASLRAIVRSGEFDSELEVIREKSKCEPLKNYLEALSAIRVSGFSEFM